MSKIVVSDTTAITHLAKIDALNLLQKLYIEILISEAVSSELVQVERTQPGALHVLNSNWIMNLPRYHGVSLRYTLRHRSADLQRHALITHSGVTRNGS